MRVLIYQPEVETPGLDEAWANEGQVARLEGLVEGKDPGLVVLPELWPGYCWAMERVSRLPCYSIAGTKRPEEGKLYNSAVLMKGGETLAHYDKTLLWESEVDEFSAGDSKGVFRAGDLRVGVLICYDMSENNSGQVRETAGESDCIAIPAFANLKYIDTAWENRPGEISGKYGKPVLVANLGGLLECPEGSFGGGRSRVVVDGREKARLGDGEGWILYDTESGKAKARDLD